MVKAIELKSISFTYKGRTRPALSNIDLSLQKRSVTLITGRSGSGKTSLIKVINGLIPHFYLGKFFGEVYFFDEDVTSLTASERFKLGISTVMQFPEDQLLSRKVWRSVAFGLANLGYPREVILRKVRWALKLVEMEFFFDKEVNSLSAGQKQKIALASALAIEPQLLLLDEPTSQLDPLSAQKFIEVLKNITKDLDLTVVISEHRVDELYDYVDEALILDNGSIIIKGPVRDVFYNESVWHSGIKVPTIINLARALGLEEKPSREEIIRVLSTRVKPKRLSNINTSGKSGEPVLRIRDLSFKYNDKKWVLKNINLNVFRGEFLVVMGHNGSGKTTLAKLMIGLLKPNKGQVIYPEKKLINPSFKELIGYVAYAPQNPEELIFNQTIYDEIAFPLRLRGINKQKLDMLVREIAKKFGIENILYKSPYSVSGGEKLRTILASIYALDPVVYIFDEPTRGLDWGRKTELIDLINRIKRDGKSIILITHDIELVSSSNIDRIIVLNNGELWLEGDKRSVLASDKILEAKLIKPAICDIFSSIGYREIVDFRDALTYISEAHAP